MADHRRRAAGGERQRRYHAAVPLLQRRQYPHGRFPWDRLQFALPVAFAARRHHLQLRRASTAAAAASASSAAACTAAGSANDRPAAPIAAGGGGSATATAGAGRKGLDARKPHAIRLSPATGGSHESTGLRGLDSRAA